MLYISDGPQPGPGDAAGVIYQTSTIVTAALIFAGTYIYLQLTNPAFGPSENWSYSRGNPEPWNIDPKNNLNDPGGKVFLIEYYILDLYNTWKDANTPDSLSLPSHKGPVLTPYDPNLYP